MGNTASRWWHAVVMLLMIAVVAPAADGQSTNARLEQRVRELERQNAELMRRLERLEGAQPSSAATGTTPAMVAVPTPAPAASDVADKDTTMEADTEAEPQGVGLGLTAAYGPVRASFQVFGDAGFGYQDPPEPDSSDTAFAI